MNWEAIGAVGEILGALAVVISLAYVAIQIRQNTEVTRVASAQNLLTNDINTHFLIASDNGLADILQKGVYEPDSLAPVEQFRFNSTYLGLYLQCDFAYRQFLRGRMEREEWERKEHEIVVFASMPGGAAWWEKDKSRFSPQFVEYLDNKLANFELPTTIPTIGNQETKSTT